MPRPRTCSGPRSRSPAGSCRRRSRSRAPRRCRPPRPGRSPAIAKSVRSGTLMTDASRRALLLVSVVTIGLLGVAPAGRAASKVERVVSPGGIEAYLIREPSIPFLSLALYFRGGSALDPAGKEGLAHMVSGLLDEGSGDLDSQAFRVELEDRAIRLSFEAGRDEFSGQLKTLTRERERAFELLGLALTKPRFDA